MLQTLSKKDIKELNEKIKVYNLEISTKERVQRINNIIIQNNVPLFFELDNKIIPTLKNNSLTFPKVYIDRGAILFIVKGADLMKPGIVSNEEFKKNDLVFIADSEHKKNLALGIALFDSAELKEIEKGKVVKNIHFVGDAIWNFALNK